MSSAITPVQYRSHDREYRLDVEVLDAAELRSRVAAVPDRGYERTDFQCFLFVESGAYRHVVDFELHECRAGSCVSIRPGQVHRFGPTSDWSGWILIAGPHHVPETVADLPSHIRLDGSLAEATAELFGRMAADAFLAADRLLLDDLLALQTRVLAQRLALGEADGGGQRSPTRPRSTATAHCGPPSTRTSTAGTRCSPTRTTSVIRARAWTGHAGR